MAQQPQQRDDSFKLQKFGGMLPAWDDLLLSEGQAASSTNGYLFSGALTGWRIPKLLRTTTLSNPGYIYRVPLTTSQTAQALLFIFTSPNEGDTVTLGEEVYKFTATVTHAYDVLIGASADASATNFFAAITYDNGAGTNAGTLYGRGTVANPAIDQTSPNTKNILATGSNTRVHVFAPDAGAAYNGTIVGESTGGWRMLWGYPTVGNMVSNFVGGANVSLDTSITGSSVFMEFVDPNTDVVRSPVVDDQYDRFYIASSSVAPQYNTRARIEAGLPPWFLGVPAPGCSPGVTVTGGGASAQIGFPTAAAGAGALGANIVYLVPITPQGAMTLNDITAVPQSSSATAGVVAVLYADLNGSPHQLLNTGVPVTGVTAGTPIASAFLNPTGLLMNVQYWIGFAASEDIVWQYADGGSKGVVSLNTFTNGPPLVINNLAVGQPDLQVWGDMTTSSVLEARAYVYTYITEYGEESPPAPATVGNGWANGTWTIDLFQPPLDQMGVTRNIVKTRIYRSVTAQVGTTTYFYVDEVPVSTAQYVDTIADNVVVTNTQLQSQLWSPPPEGMQGFVVMPNGILAGWKANEIWFCEPYRPHAWPPSYVLTTEHNVVGLGVTGNSVVAATEGSPYVATGVSPGAMSTITVQNPEPCHSRKSVIGNSDGVYYCSRNGLILVSQYGQVTNTTETWITREKWQQLTPQGGIAAVLLGGMYFAWQTAPNGNENGQGNQGFTIEINQSDSQSFTIWPQPGGHRLGLQLLANALANGLAMVQVDHWSAVVYALSRNGMYYWDFSDPAPQLTVADWTSKKFQQRTRKNFEAMRIKFRIPPNTPPQNPTRKQDPTNDPSWLAPLPPDRYGYILVYADGGSLVTAREIRVPQEVLRIQSGFKHETWQFRIISRVVIETVQVGTTVKGMANV